MSACEMRLTSPCVCLPCSSTLKLLTTSQMTTRVSWGSRPGQGPEVGASVHMGSGFPHLEPCAGGKSVTWVWSED